jgi:iron transport multicopper oxidase
VTRGNNYLEFTLGLLVMVMTYEVSMCICIVPLAGKTYRLRISNVGSQHTLNFRIEGHRLLLVETEGSYVIQTYYTSLDIHVGQSYSVMVTMDQSVAADFYVVASTRFSEPVLYGLAVLHYSTSRKGLNPGVLPPGPNDIDFSFEQARSIR